MQLVPILTYYPGTVHSAHIKIRIMSLKGVVERHREGDSKAVVPPSLSFSVAVASQTPPLESTPESGWRDRGQPPAPVPVTLSDP